MTTSGIMNTWKNLFMLPCNRSSIVPFSKLLLFRISSDLTWRVSNFKIGQCVVTSIQDNSD